MTVASGIDQVDLRPGSHVCAFYRGSDERDRLLRPYLRAGLRAGDKCVCVVDSARTAAGLTEAGLDAAASGTPDEGGHAGRAQQLDVLLPETTYLLGGTFAIAAMLAFWQETLARSLADGFAFSRLAGEMTWALRDVPGVEHLVAYESELNRLTPNFPTVVLCLYDLDRFSGEVIVDVVKTHPFVLVQGILVENPYHVEPDEFLRTARN